MTRIRELREESGLKLKELSKIIGVSESTMSLYENGKHEPDYTTLIKIADYFKGIAWKQLNTKHKNKFAEAVKEIMDGFLTEGIDCDKINKEIQKVYQEIEELTISTKRSALRPPK